MRILLTVLVLFSFIPPLPAYQEQQNQELLSRVYEIKHGPSHALVKLLEPFGTRTVWVEELKAVSITATERQHVAIEEILKRYDVPSRSARTIRLQFYLIRADMSGPTVEAVVPPQVEAILREIASLTRYQRFELIDSPLLRLTGTYLGQISAAGEQVGYQIRVLHREGSNPDDDENAIRLENLTISVTTVQEKLQAGITTSVSMKGGETVVIGTTQLKGEGALIAVLTGSIE
jgi:hypothetical protein